MCECLDDVLCQITDMLPQDCYFENTAEVDLRRRNAMSGLYSAKRKVLKQLRLRLNAGNPEQILPTYRRRNALEEGISE